MVLIILCSSIFLESLNDITFILLTLSNHDLYVSQTSNDQCLFTDCLVSTVITQSLI